MKAAVIVFPGSNCDWDCYHVAKKVLNAKTDLVWHEESSIKGYDLIIVPGGFSYGDYLRSGAIARFSPVMNSIIEYVKKDRGLVLGICNGFQILTEAGLLPGALQKNRHLKFLCKNVSIRVENAKTPFTNKCKKGQVLTVPIAHFDGNYTADKETLAKIEKKGQVVFRYCSPSGSVSAKYNPNGSMNNIAGICNEARNVLGMMPHPERVTEKVLGCEDGVYIFRSILNS
ncbi:MAG: phosphoribosylformylglycinamidine synthase subunit PurQ [Candidatus Saganbacteria bacterium]|nr:phosphoribosylformylglycinamidine synthase subunit PurQ [Candidatus Saganbacteria bacterium]